MEKVSEFGENITEEDMATERRKTIQFSPKILTFFSKLWPLMSELWLFVQNFIFLTILTLIIELIFFPSELGLFLRILILIPELSHFFSGLWLFSQDSDFNLQIMTLISKFGIFIFRIVTLNPEI